MRGGRWRSWKGQRSQREGSTHDKHSNILSQCAMCKGWVWQHRAKTTKTITTTRTLTCSCCASCWFSGSWFSRCHWCRTPQRPARRFYSSTAFHHASAIPSAKFFSSGCCSPTVSCHRPLNLYPKFLHTFIAKTGLLRCCLYTFPTTQQEHSVHPAHLHEHPVDEVWHQWITLAWKPSQLPQFHVDSNSVEIRHVTSGTLPCVWITSLKRLCTWRQMPFPTCWGRSRRRLVRKNQWP